MIWSVMSLWCGGADHAQEATLWIHGQDTPSVRTELNQGGKVWLYRNVANEIVGFGSLALRTWEVEGEESITLQYIPMLGIFTEHQGLPPPGSGVPKYCYQLIDDLIDQAALRQDEYPWLGLSVRPENGKAIHVYEKVGFKWFKPGQGWSRMVLPLT